MFKPFEVDLNTGKDEIDRQEKEYLAEEAAKSVKAKKRGKFYKTFIGWLL
jgi:amino acid transporter